MKRYSNFSKRSDFQAKLENIGFDYWNLQGPANKDYWQEGVVYVLSEHEVDAIQQATQDLHEMSMEMVSKIVTSGDYPEYFKLSNLDKLLIEKSWNEDQYSLYGRFDLALDHANIPKMLEYNGDTPVSILECSVAQWDYISSLATLPNGMKIPEALKIQYNLIDETLIELWKDLYTPSDLVHFASSGGFRHEDFGNLCYLMDTAYRAGIQVKQIHMQDIGWDGSKFLDLENKEIKDIFKLYPWEWMTQEDFGRNIQWSNTRWMEPAWKMLLSNKAMLIKLWEMFPNHPNLLPSFHETNKPTRAKWAKKAIHGREGSNIYQSLFADGEHLSTHLAPGAHEIEEYNQWGYMYQYWMDITKHNGMTPIIGSWVIGSKACGMSIREDQNVVTGHDAQFASHIFVPYDLEDEFKFLL